MARGRRLTTSSEVLVVGAGPTGLTAALQAHRHGAQVRVVERRPVASRPSRALVVHAGTLESLRHLAVTDALLAHAVDAPTAELHLGRRRIPVQLEGAASSPPGFPRLTLVRQAAVEEVLTQALQDRGVEVERGVELVRAAGGPDAARATLHGRGRLEEVACGFLLGCDGPDSTTRRAAAIGWRGGTYREEVVLADVELAGDLTPGRLHVVAARPGLVFLFALGEGATWRLLATRPGHDVRAAFGQPGQEVPAREVQQLLDAAGLGAVLTRLHWSTRVRLQHKVADSFRRGRVFLAGDAAHSHSPAAAQGMNTGMLDAVNLGWKVAFAGQGDGQDGDHAVLLESYGLERRPVARQVRALTHLVYGAEASTHALPAFFRGTVLPLGAPVVPALVRQPALVGAATWLLSQRWVNHRRSPLSVRGTPTGAGPRPGDHLPDQAVRCEGRTTSLHALTARPGVHVLLQRDAAALDAQHLGPRVVVHRIASWPGQGVVAVRPDGYVGFDCATCDPVQLSAWLALAGAGRPADGS